MAVGFIDLPKGTELYPGGSTEATIAFWCWPDLADEIYPGRQWRIQEGANLVEIGTVLELLTDADELTF